MARMINRFGRWWPLWVTLAVMWTLVVVMYGWINLPRANQVPHNPQFLAKLSNEAASIMFGRYAKAEPGRGVLVWSEVPRTVRMSNGARLTFPATATNERVALVAGEYDQLLSAEADKQRGPYLLEMLAIWLAPLLVAGFAASLLGRGYRSSPGKAIAGGCLPMLVRSTVASSSAMSGTFARMDGDIAASSAADPVRASFRRSAHASGEVSRMMFTNEERKPRERAAATAMMGRP